MTKIRTYPLKFNEAELETFRRRAKAAGISQQKYAKAMILDGKLPKVK